MSLLYTKKGKEQIEDLQTPVKFRNNQNYGLFHPASKQVIVKPNYTYIEDFSNGYCLGIRGEEGGICDVINTVGKVVFSYETAPLSHTYCFNGFFLLYMIKMINIITVCMIVKAMKFLFVISSME